MKAQIKRISGDRAIYSLTGDVQSIRARSLAIDVSDPSKHVIGRGWTQAETPPLAHWTGTTYDVRDVLRSVDHARAQDDGWRGCVEFSADYVVATDGHRLVRVPNLTGLVGVLPEPVVDLLVAIPGAMLDVGDGVYRVRSRHVVAQAPEADVRFPNWRSLIDGLDAPTWTVQLDPHETRSRCTDGDVLTVADGRWTWTRAVQRVDGTRADVVTTGEADGHGRVKLNGKYLDDALSAGCVVSGGGELDPVVVRAGERLDVVMPMRGN
jgi:hypothetical protein